MNIIADAFMIGLRAGAVMIGFLTGIMGVLLIIAGIGHIVRKIRGSDE